MMTDEPFDVPMMIMMDPPEHTRLRKLVSRAFTPRRIADLEGKITAICAGFLDPLRDQDEFDYIDTFAGLLPPTVILALLGFPEGHAAGFRASADAAMHLEEGTTMSGAVRPGQSLVSASGELGSEAFAMLPELMEARRRKPEDDLISVLVNAQVEVDGEGKERPLTEEELFAFVQLLSIAGTETVARLLGFAAVTLARFPDQRQLLIDDPSLIPNAVEELLRYEAPSPVQSRWVARDIELHGTVVKRGSKISLLNGSADRDERHFEDPDRFDVRRVHRPSPRVRIRHALLHRCRAGPARRHGRAAGDAAAASPPGRSTRAGLERVHTSTVRGYSHVPMRVR